MEQINIGICGLGTVGRGTFDLLTRNAELMAQRTGTSVTVSHIGTSQQPELFSSIDISRDVFAVATDPKVDILVELIGGTTVAKELVLKAISHGKHIVTANKALIAEHGNEIFAAAADKGVAVSYEAAVAGGIPIIGALKNGLAANDIQWAAGIINGTGNFILTEMHDKGRDFADVLEEAQRLGYAEADPTFDVEGIDAAHKLAIIASIAFGIPLQFDSVFTEGISGVEPVDLTNADELGYRIKHVGIARRSAEGVEMRVHPTLIPESNLIANVDGVMNAVMVEGDAVGPTLYCGAGAGAGPTGSSVVADIVDISRQMAQGASPNTNYLGVAQSALDSMSVLDIKDCETALYLRFNALDESGVLSQITSVFSASNINVEVVIQKDVPPNEKEVPIVIVTGRALQSEFDALLTQLEALDVVVSPVASIRVEALSN